ncbi:MAG: hypothetical protein QNJ31_02560 [Candidatus Caenarcaniphilales bacterium]|nr:hypothetical protein [Candidatus Caenarcaniphilales bacterium]
MREVQALKAQMELEKLINDLTQSSEPIQINGSVNNAILVSEQDWIAIQEALYYLSIPGVIESIENSGTQLIKDGEFHFGLN